jgi:ribose transport system substrate-binding protein
MATKRAAETATGFLGHELLRREFLRRGGAGLFGIAAGAGLLAGCGSNGNGSQADAPTRSNTQLEAWNPDAAPVSGPDLPSVIATSLPSNVEFWQRTMRGMEVAGEDLGLDVLQAVANDDSARNISQMESFLQRGVGGLVIHPIEPNAQAAVAERALSEGICVQGNVFAPSVCHDTASQYRIGNRMGLAAAKYIRNELGGEAQVLLFNGNNIEALKPLNEGMIDGLKKAPGARIAENLTMQKATKEWAFGAANTALRKHPDINVVLGYDTTSLGSLAAFEAAGKARDSMYFAGVDGEQEAVDKVRQGGPYKATFAWPMEALAYAWTEFTARWLDGKTIPKVIDLGVAELSSAAAIDDFEAAMADPKSSWRNHPDLEYLGNINYETRDQYFRKVYDLEA